MGEGHSQATGERMCGERGLLHLFWFSSKRDSNSCHLTT